MFSNWRFSWRTGIYRLPKIRIGDLNIYAEHRVPVSFDERIRYKRWVVLNETNIVAVVDHVKPNGQLGVRPIDPKTGAYKPNSSPHWTWPDRLRIPEEWALYEDEVRNAMENEIPKIIRNSE